MVSRQVCNQEMMQRMHSYKKMFEATEDFVSKYTKQRQIGVLKPANQETLQEFRVLFYMASADCEKDPTVIETECNNCFDLVKKHEIRKKAIFVHTQSAVFCIGGYLFDPIEKSRDVPKNDWSYNTRTKNLTAIPAVPDGRLNFGCASTLGKIYVIAGMSFNNVPLESCYRFDVYEGEWERLPDLQSSPSWAGVTVTDKLECTVIGGYSLKGGCPYSSAECYMLRLGARKWQKLPDLPKAGCNIMTASDGTSIFAMGGRQIGPKGSGASLDEIFSLTTISATGTNDKQKWEYVTSIPEYDIKTTNLVYETGRIFATDRPITSTDPEVPTPEAVTKFTYVFKNNKWYKGRREAKAEVESKDSTSPSKENAEPTKEKTKKKKDSSKSKKKK